jgi:ELWxxDGT repeat protein
VRHLTCGGGKAYFAAPEGPTNWGVYEYEPARRKSRLLQGGLRYPPQELLFWQNKLFFSVPGASLWVCDGAKAVELQSVKQPRKAAAQFTPFGNALYFVSPPSGKEKRGGELWKTDGTRAGTTKVRGDLWMLLGGSAHWQTDMAHAQSLQASLGKLFFVTCETDRQGKPELETFALWVSDGTAKGTIQLATKRPAVLAIDNGNAPRGSFLGVAFKGKLYFSADNKLWESDGTPAGTRESALRIRSPNYFAFFQGRLLLSGWHARGRRQKGGAQLILTDGTTAGTRSFSASVNELRQITVIDDKRFCFVGNDGLKGDELWVSDGTAANTRLVRECRPGPAGGVIDNLIRLKGQVYFTAGDEPHGYELWRTDGSAEKTQVADLLPGPEGSLCGQLRAADGKLYFYTTAIVKGRQLWCCDPERPQLTFRRP